MILDDGKGFAIDTESKPLTLEQQITNLSAQIAELKLKIGRLGRTRERQTLKTQYDIKVVELKRLNAKAKQKNKES